MRIVLYLFLTELNHMYFHPQVPLCALWWRDGDAEWLASLDLCYVLLVLFSVLWPKVCHVCT